MGNANTIQRLAWVCVTHLALNSLISGEVWAAWILFYLTLAFSRLVFTITGKQVVELVSVYVYICRKRYLRRPGVSVLWLLCSYLFALSLTLKATWKPGVLKVALTAVCDCVYPNTINSVSSHFVSTLQRGGVPISTSILTKLFLSCPLFRIEDGDYFSIWKWDNWNEFWW